MRRRIRACVRKVPGLVDAYVASRRALRNLAQTPDVVRLRLSRRRLPGGGDPAGVVVSLTSFPARIRHAWIAVESVLRQDRAPDRVVLVLSREEFGATPLPRRLREQQQRGLEILYTERDGRGFDKLVPTRLAYPGATIVTVDDDAIYEPWALSRLLEHSERRPGAIIGHRGREIRLDGRGLAPYLEWPLASEATPPGRALLTGVGGILYPPDALPLDLLTDPRAMELCPTADDVWFWAVATVSGVPIHCLDEPSWRPLRRQDHTPRAATVNRAARGNDAALARVIGHFGITLVPEGGGRPEPGAA